MGECAVVTKGMVSVCCFPLPMAELYTPNIVQKKVSATWSNFVPVLTIWLVYTFLRTNKGHVAQTKLL